MPKHWNIFTPQYTEYYYDEPPEIMLDWVAVEADTKREALVKGVRELRRIGSHWLKDQQGDKSSPFTGLKADRAECEHGNCWCDLCSGEANWRECPQCLADKPDQEEEIY